MKIDDLSDEEKDSFIETVIHHIEEEEEDSVTADTYTPILGVRYTFQALPLGWGKT